MSDFFFIYIQLQNLFSETKLWEQNISSAVLLTLDQNIANVIGIIH